MIKTKIQEDLKDAMRARDKEKVEALRLITAAIKQIEVDERIDVDDVRMLSLLGKLSKQRNESIAQFKAANRLDLVAKEEYELTIIKQYLPEPMSLEEITSIVDEAVQVTGASQASDMGKVMTLVKQKIQGRADMSQVSQLIKAKLA